MRVLISMKEHILDLKIGTTALGRSDGSHRYQHGSKQRKFRGHGMACRRSATPTSEVFKAACARRVRQETGCRWEAMPPAVVPACVCKPLRYAWQTPRYRKAVPTPC